MIGKLNQRVKFQKAKRVDNGQGGYIIDDANLEVVAILWAGVELINKSAVELYRGRRVEFDAIITIRDNDLIQNFQYAVTKYGEFEIIDIAPADKTGYSLLTTKRVIK